MTIHARAAADLVRAYPALLPEQIEFALGLTTAGLLAELEQVRNLEVARFYSAEENRQTENLILELLGEN